MTSKLSGYSTTPANNNAASPNGWPEGALPSTINDCNREFAARVREWYEDSEWIDNGHTIVSSTSASIKLSGDLTGTYVAGRAIRVNQSSSQIGRVYASAYSAPDTSITVSGFTVSSPTQVEVGVLSQYSSLPAFTSGKSTTAGSIDFPEALGVRAGLVIVDGPNVSVAGAAAMSAVTFSSPFSTACIAVVLSAVKEGSTFSENAESNDCEL